MEIMDVLHWLIHNHQVATRGISPGIIPTVLIPLTALTVGLSSLAGLIAGQFGVKLNTEGPKQLLEVLLKKRVIISMVLMNLVGFLIYRGYVYVKTMPSFLTTVKWQSSKNARALPGFYTDSLSRTHSYSGIVPKAALSGLTLIKEAKIPKGAFRSSAVSGGSLFAGSDDGYVYEIDQQTLEIKRKFYIGVQVTTRPVIFNGRLYAGEGTHLTHHARIYSFDLKTGEFYKAFETKGHTEGQPIVVHYRNQDFMVVPAGADGLYVINPNTMEKIWHANDGHTDATASIENGTIYLGTGVEKGKLSDRSYAVARNITDSQLIWKKELPLSSWMHPVITKVDVCYTLGEIYTPSTVGLLYCLNKKTGEPHFSLPFNAPIASKPYYISEGENEYLFLATMSGEVCGVNLGQKEKIWCHKTAKSDSSDNYALTSVEYDEAKGILWYPSPDNGLYGFSAREGKQIVHWRPKEKETPWSENYAAVNVVGNKIYHIDIDGHIRMFNVL